MHRLTPRELEELDSAVVGLSASGKPIASITAADYPLLELGAAIQTWRTTLESGRGFFLIRGFPVRKYTKEQAAFAFWIIGAHLGEPVSQNSDGDLLGPKVLPGRARCSTIRSSRSLPTSSGW
jgi:Taurine catabolism dioxygenase TauD, TfdA family